MLDWMPVDQVWMIETKAFAHVKFAAKKCSGPVYETMTQIRDQQKKSDSNFCFN